MRLNTLDRTMARKRKKAIGQLEEGLRQFAGAINYLKRTRPLRMQMEEGEIAVDLDNRNVLGLVVVRELFNDSYDAYSSALFESLDKTGQPCIALDYPELQQYATYCNNEELFLGAYFQVFDAAHQHSEFPRLRFGLNDAKKLMAREANEGE